MASSPPIASCAPRTEAATPAVLGPPGLAREIVLSVLRADGRAASAPSPEAGRLPPVTVLVDPTAAHWAAAESIGGSIVLVFSHEPSDAEVVEAVLAGAEAVVSASSAPARLAHAIDAVLDRGTLLQPSHVRALANAARACQREAAVSLTPREREIIASIARGEGVKQTALSLGIAAKTVENLQSHLFRKLGVRNRAHAVVRAHALGLLNADGPDLWSTVP